MAQIFISHSANDRVGVEFFSKIFSGTNVRAVFEEYEKLNGSLVNTQTIKAHINESNCIFILLDENVEAIKHTRDWVVWESGYGAQNNRDVWIFEKQKDLGKLSVVMPSLQHYVLYDIEDSWFPYLRAIIQSYDNSNVIKTTLATTAIGGTISDSKDKFAGLLIGALTGLIISNNNIRPMGVSIKCINCESIYSVHIPQHHLFRCPVCNTRLQLNPAFC